jgi:phospholipid/cholesterol/gamma-HCH transport system substrate-binding protein
LSAFSRQLSSILTEKEVKALQNIISNSDSLINEAKNSFEVSGQISSILNNIKIFSSELTSMSSNLDASFQPRLNKIDSILIEIEDFTNDLEIVTSGFSSFNSSASNLDSSMVILNGLVKEMNEGKGTLGKLLKDDSLYDNLNEVVDNTNSLINQVTADPKSFFNININFGGSK